MVRIGLVSAAPFHTTRPRDAWSTIRGFVYQVALTVERWLFLSDDDALELEAGEDIDLCIGALTFADADQERVLEQIKHREGSVTLRTDEARAFLANAYEHQNNNPGRHLVSRLISTAPAGQETPTPLSPRAPALERWAEINAKSDPVVDKLAIEAIISLLREAKQPRNFNEQTWNIFASFVRVAQAAEFARFMAHVEWALGADEHEDVEPSIKMHLVSDGWCSSAETATSAYQHLFFHVFHLLAKRGTKRLTKASLQATLDQQERTEADVRVWKRVLDLFAEHDVRISILETEAAATRATIQSLARSQNVEPDLVLVNRRRNFAPPPSVADYVDRTALNMQLAAKFKSSRIVHIIGESGIGKTQLVRAVASLTTASWVRLRHRTGHEVLDAIAVGKEHAIANGHELLILDDIGRIADSDPVSESIAELINKSIVTVSTSLFDMSARLRSDLGSTCETMSVPAWGTPEAHMLLTLLGAPQALLADTAIEMFLAITRGHPSLLRALATYLRQRAWAVDEAALQALFSADYAKAERAEARR